MLRAYVDDSEFQRGPPLFIFAGYIATAERWAAFSDEWQRALDRSPKIRYFKLREAFSRRGQFVRFSEQESAERIALCRGIVEAHVQAEFAIVVRKDWLKESFEAFGKPLSDPCYFSFYMLISEVASNLQQMGLVPDQLDFVFDNRAMEQRSLIAGWEMVKSYNIGVAADLPEILRSPPCFRNDEEELPLQAADMQATISRLRLTEDFDPDEFGWESKPGLLIDFDRETLERAARELRLRHPE